METIDRLVHGEEINSGVGAIGEKILTLQSMAIQLVVPTRLLHPPIVGFEELSLLTRDEVFPHLKFDCLKTKGILFIDGNLFAKGVAGPQGQLPVNVSREGLKEYLDFPGSKDSSRVNQEGPLLVGDEPRNTFGDTQAQWDAERCELVRERDRLKEDLLKVQDVLANAKQREEAL
ncbi:hypothetical protein R1flu_006346 [Riccia fluitans]|uniref:Uncharacterized protein n=1 Tax=Riccia fluitans TaxID=41844 RepID=A0ABD1YZT9_9MARC